MRTYKKILAAAALVVGAAPYGFGMGHEVVNTDNFNLNIGGRIQEVGYGEVVHALPSFHANLSWTFCVLTGGFRDVPLRFLPEQLAIPMLVARVGYNDGLDKDIFTVAQNDLHPSRVVKASYVNGMYMKDTRI